jgi:hypothetical protein
MTRLAISSLFFALLLGCTPTYQDYLRDSDRVFRGYLTGDVRTAKAALLAEEKIIADHEARGTRGVDFPMARRMVYMQLSGLSAYMGQTNDANAYLQRFIEVSGKREVTLQHLIVLHEKQNQELKPKWRQQK